MTLDVTTLFVASMAIEVVMALYFWSLWLGHREQRIYLWIAASVTAGLIGCLCFTLRGVAPDWIAIWAAQVCFIQVFAFLWAAVRRVHARAHPLAVTWIGSAAWTLACLIPALFAAEAPRNVVATLAFTAYCIAMSVELVRREGDRASLSRWMTATLLGLLSASSIALAVHTVGSREPVVPLQSTSALPGLWLLLYTAIYVTLVLSVTTLELGNEAQRQREAATTDALTGLLNRRAFVDTAGRLVAEPHGAMLLMLDIDHFKQVNDRWGHSAGDRALVLFAGALHDAVAPVRLARAARIGGEEFAVLLPAASRAAAVALAEQIAARVRLVRHTPGAPALTVSIGLADGSGADRPLDDLLAAADRALYRAKRGGRDRLEQEAEPGAGAVVHAVFAASDAPGLAA